MLNLLIKVSRPVFWIVGPLVFFVGLKVAEAEITGLVIVQMLLLSFPYCIFLFGFNDVYDYRSDKLNKRKAALLDPKHHRVVKQYGLVSAMIILVAAIATFNPLNIVFMILLLLLSYFYSAPPLRLREKPPLDSIANGLIILLLFAIGHSLGNAGITFPQQAYFLAATVAGLHAVTTIMDFDADKKAGMNTFSIMFGKRTAGGFALSVAVIAILFSQIQSLAINIYLYTLAVFFALSIIYPKPKFLLAVFKLGYLTAIVAALIFLYQQFYI